MAPLTFQQEVNWFLQTIRSELPLKNNFLPDGHAGEISFAASPFARCPALIETPVIANSGAKVFNWLV